MKTNVITKLFCMDPNRSTPSAMKGLALGAAVFAMIAAGALPAQAGIAQVTSRSALAGNDLLNWSQLAIAGAPLPSPVTVTTNGGLVATLSNAGLMYYETEGTGGAPWNGNFAPAAPLIFTGQYGPAAPFVITFATPVSAVGAQMNYNSTNPPSNPLPFNISMSLYNSAGQLLAAYTAQGEQYAKPNNSAVFIGAVDSQAEISQVVFFTTTTEDPYPGSFAINNVSIDAPRHCTQ
jgi:hypothetical protein